jgi:Brp/Blh family beta-carotene 15,15'-monooxygenase
MLIAGIALLIIQQWFHPVPDNIQFIMFLSGIVVVGIPHGAADLLVASKNAQSARRKFSSVRFLVHYVFRLVLFAAILWFFPLAGNLLFIIFAAYHFGETDLHQFKTNTITGKVFVFSYGLVILAVILLNHFEQVKPMYMQFQSGRDYIKLIDFISLYRHVILSGIGLLYFVSGFVYFLLNRDNVQQQGLFLVRFTVIIFILYHLPVMLGFTFYFVFWHSLLSLRNVVNYLQESKLHSMKVIVKQLALYSSLAIAGISIFGLTGSMFYNTDAMTVYVFLGLAVLTAPHMGVMYEMYLSIRNHKSLADVPAPVIKLL